MSQWGPFLAVCAVLLVVLLVLARRSQELFREDEADSSDADTPATAASDEQVSLEPSERVTPDTAEKIPTPGEEAEAQEWEDVTGRPDGRELTTEMMFANVGLTQGLVVVIIVGAAWLFAIPATAFGIGGDTATDGLTAVAIGLGFGVVLWIANEGATAVADAVGAAYDEAVRELLAPETASGWVVLFGVVLPTIALAEELLFRGALVGVPAAGYGVSVWGLAVVSSVAFALGHGAQGRVGIVVTGALGFVLAAGYILTGSLLVVVVAHYVINALEFFVHELLESQGLTVERLAALTR